MKPFLILQLRPETDASDSEYQAFLDKTGLPASRTTRIRLDQSSLPADLNPADFAGIIVGGGPGCVSDAPASKDPVDARAEAQMMGMMPRICGEDIPFMGCCYGMGILGAHLGASVDKSRFGEPVGTSLCHKTGAKDSLIEGLPEQFQAFVGHKEAVNTLPPGCVHLLASDPCPYQMLRYGQNVYATQFHPEADAEEFKRRVHVYRNHGYFAPDEVEGLLAICDAADVHAPAQILRRFAERYS